MFKKRKLYKKPSDYPQLTFRIDKESKESIQDRVNSLVENISEDTPSDCYAIKKNAIYREALLIGLSNLEKKYE